MKKVIEIIIFNTKWLLIPFLLVLALALAVYTYFDIKEFIEYLLRIRRLNKESAMLTFVELIDITMIASLGKMIITGSYNSFVSKSHGVEGENISSGMLKVKMATSLVGVTAIALLQKSIDIYKVDWDTLYKLAFVHVIFLLSAIFLSVVDYLHLKSSMYEIHESSSNGISKQKLPNKHDEPKGV